jgi:hypothetical protein
MHILITGGAGFSPVTTMEEGIGKFMAWYGAYYA